MPTATLFDLLLVNTHNSHAIWELSTSNNQLGNGNSFMFLYDINAIDVQWALGSYKVGGEAVRKPQAMPPKSRTGEM